MCHSGITRSCLCAFNTLQKMRVRVEYFQNMFFFANLRVKLEHVRVCSVFICLP